MRLSACPKKLTVTIISDPDLLNANPFVEGTQFIVYDIVVGCDEVGVHVFLQDCPGLDLETVREVMQYCQARRCDEAGAWCTGCSRRMEQEGVTSAAAFIRQFEAVQFMDSDDVIRGGTEGGGIIMLPGTPEQMDLHWRGENGWQVAARLLRETDLA
ncbi:MAG TPA: hypothetical protein ENJ01_04410 [Gammaproteobacteria bacterium]|nr:hypothetical protein [Gammaproteobacteria bacterium]